MICPECKQEFMNSNSLSVCPYCGAKIIFPQKSANYNIPNPSDDNKLNDERVLRGTVAAIISSIIPCAIYFISLSFSKHPTIIFAYAVLWFCFILLIFTGFSKPKSSSIEISLKGLVISAVVTVINLAVTLWLSKAVVIQKGLKEQGIIIDFKKAFSLVPEYIRTNPTAKENIVTEILGIFLPIIAVTVIFTVRKIKNKKAKP